MDNLQARIDAAIQRLMPQPLTAQQIINRLKDEFTGEVYSFAAIETSALLSVRAYVGEAKPWVFQYHFDV